MITRLPEYFSDMTAKANRLQNYDCSMLKSFIFIQQQHSLLSQASWGKLEMKLKINKDKRNTKRHETEGTDRGKQK
jgi:hypothetical protein